VLTSLSVAPATTAPLLSATVPVILPLTAANNDIAPKRRYTTNSAEKPVLIAGDREAGFDPSTMHLEK
jgi:hypothetical protein